MNHDEMNLVVSAKADEVTELVPGFDGLLVIATAADRENGETALHSAVRGNRHAVLGAVREWLRRAEDYDAGYHGEEGRYDSVVHRQRAQARGTSPPQ